MWWLRSIEVKFAGSVVFVEQRKLFASRVCIVSLLDGIVLQCLYGPCTFFCRSPFIGIVDGSFLNAYSDSFSGGDLFAQWKVLPRRQQVLFALTINRIGQWAALAISHNQQMVCSGVVCYKLILCLVISG